MDPSRAPAGLDPAGYKDSQRVVWNAVSDGWARWRREFEFAARPVTEWLLEAADLRPGARVLDAGTGVGEPALSAARRVGRTGRVVGVDLAPGMLAQARRRAAAVPQVAFVLGDFEELDLPARSFDAVLSRWGLMFAADRVAALRSSYRVLVPGGVVALAVWAAPAANPMTRLGFQTLSEGLDLPAPPAGGPGPFALADPAVLRDAVTAAGFIEPSVVEVPVTLRLRSAAEYAAYAWAVLPPELTNALGRRYGAGARAHATAALAAAADRYREPGGGVALAGLALCLRAVRPTEK